MSYQGDNLLCPHDINSLWPSDAIRWHRSESTMAQVMACCLTAPSHYLNQCWLLLIEVLQHLPQRNFTVSAQATILWHKFANYTINQLRTISWIEMCCKLPMLFFLVMAWCATGNKDIALASDHKKSGTRFCVCYQNFETDPMIINYKQ